MKIRVGMKCPDALDYAISDAAVDEEEVEAIKKLASKWFSYGEFVTIEIDTETREAIVLPRKRH